MASMSSREEMWAGPTTAGWVPLCPCVHLRPSPPLGGLAGIGVLVPRGSSLV